VLGYLRTARAVCACILRFKGVAPRGARSSSCPGYLWLNAWSLLLFSSISSVRAGVAPPALALPSPSRPLLRSGLGLGLCRLFPLLSAGRAAPCLCGGCADVSPRAASSCGLLASVGAVCRFLRAVTLSTVSVTFLPFARHIGRRTLRGRLLRSLAVFQAVRAQRFFAFAPFALFCSFLHFSLPYPPTPHLSFHFFLL
jgi:hypothetical protein